MYIRWLTFLGGFQGLKSFDYEFQRSTESCAEHIDESRKYYHRELGTEHQVCIGLLCNPKGVVRTFPNDAWSKLENKKLTRGKDGHAHRGYYDKPKRSTHHTEAWVKPGNFVGIVVAFNKCGYLGHENIGHQGIENLDGKTKRMLKTAASKYNVPLYQWTHKQQTIAHYCLREVEIGQI